MGISIQPYILEGTRFSYEPGSSGSFPIMYLVSGLDPTNPLNPVLACRATDSTTGFQIPAYGSPVSGVANFYVGRFEAEPFPANSRTQVMVKLTALPPELMPGAVKIDILSASGQATIKSRWAFGPQEGQPILVGYSADKSVSFPAQIDPSDAADWSEDPSSGKYASLAEMRVLNPNTVLRFSWRQSGSPLKSSRLYRRMLNKATWQGDPPGTWLCTSFDGENIVQGDFVAPNLYNVTATFECDESGDGWAQYPVFHTLTGGIPTDIKIDGSYRGYTVAVPYGSIDFNQLNLPSAL